MRNHGKKFLQLSGIDCDLMRTQNQKAMLEARKIPPCRSCRKIERLLAVKEWLVSALAVDLKLVEAEQKRIGVVPPQRKAECNQLSMI